MATVTINTLEEFATYLEGCIVNPDDAVAGENFTFGLSVTDELDISTDLVEDHTSSTNHEIHIFALLNDEKISDTFYKLMYNDQVQDIDIISIPDGNSSRNLMWTKTATQNGTNDVKFQLDHTVWAGEEQEVIDTITVQSQQSDDNTGDTESTENNTNTESTGNNTNTESTGNNTNTEQEITITTNVYEITKTEQEITITLPEKIVYKNKYNHHQYLNKKSSKKLSVQHNNKNWRTLANAYLESITFNSGTVTNETEGTFNFIATDGTEYNLPLPSSVEDFEDIITSVNPRHFYMVDFYSNNYNNHLVDFINTVLCDIFSDEDIISEIME